MKQHIPSAVIIVILIGMLFLQRECQRCTEPDVITTIDTIPGDALPILVTIDQPVPEFVFVDTGSWNYFAIDTMAIIRDYFAKAVYLDTLKNDSSAFIALIDTVHMNRLQGRQLTFLNRRPTSIIHTTTIQQPDYRVKLYAGAMFALTPEERSDFGPALVMMTPRGAGYSYAYGISEKTHTLSIVWRINLRKKWPS